MKHFCWTDNGKKYNENLWVVYNNGVDGQFVQSMDGTFIYGYDFEKIHEPINIAIELMEGVVIHEQPAETLSEYVNEVVQMD